MQANSNPIQRWFKYPEAATYSGIGKRALQNYVKDGLIRSSNVCAPGASRGIRLIDRESLDLFIEAGIGKKSDLAMNANRRNS